MGVAIGFAWMHYSKQYRDQFGSPPPDWLNVISIIEKLRLVKISLRLKWRLPQALLIGWELSSKK